MSKKGSFNKLLNDLIWDLKELEARCLKPSKKLRMLTNITEKADVRLKALEHRETMASEA